MTSTAFWLLAWTAGAIATAAYGAWCQRLVRPGQWLDAGEPIILVFWMIWPIVLPWLIGAHVRRGRKKR